MGKVGRGMVQFHHDKLLVIGGYGFPTGPTHMTGHVKKKSLAFSKFDAGGPEKLSMLQLNYYSVADLVLELEGAGGSTVRRA